MLLPCEMEKRNTWTCSQGCMCQLKGGIVTWNAVKVKFLDNYFLKDLRKQKAKEFLDLKQGNMLVREYTFKFNKLLQYWPQYQDGRNEEDLCSQYEKGLRPQIQQVVCYMHIIDFAQLVTKNMIFESKIKDKQAIGGSRGPQKNQNFNHNQNFSGKQKPYFKFNSLAGGCWGFMA